MRYNILTAIAYIMCALTIVVNGIYLAAMCGLI